jgi:hypothetical protein
MLDLVKDPRDQVGFLPGTIDNRIGIVEFSESMRYSYVETRFYDLEKRFTALEIGDDFGPVDI